MNINDYNLFVKTLQTTLILQKSLRLSKNVLSTTKTLNFLKKSKLA